MCRENDQKRWGISGTWLPLRLIWTGSGHRPSFRCILCWTGWLCRLAVWSRSNQSLSSRLRRCTLRRWSTMATHIRRYSKRSTSVRCSSATLTSLAFAFTLDIHIELRVRLTERKKSYDNFVPQAWSNMLHLLPNFLDFLLTSKALFFQVNPFTPESDQCQNSPAASQEIWHHTVQRIWLFIAYSDEKWLYYEFSLHHSYNCFLKGWENTLFELRSERVNTLSVWIDGQNKLFLHAMWVTGSRPVRGVFLQRLV